MSDFYYGPDAAAAMPLMQGANTVPGKLDLATMFGSLFPALRDRGGSADYAPQAFRPAEGAPSPAVLPQDPKLATMPGAFGPGAGVPYPATGTGGGPFGLDAGGPVLQTADRTGGTDGAGSPPGSPAPSLPSKTIGPSPTDNPQGPTPTQRPEKTTVRGAPPASLFQRLGIGDWNTSRMLLSMAAGFGGAHNIGEGIGRAAGNVANTIPGIQQSQMSVAGVNLTARYLQSKGLSGDDALAVAVNPELAKGIIPLVTGTSNKFENGLVINGQGKPIADFRYLLPSHTAEVEAGGEKSTVQVDPYGGLHQAHVQGNNNTVQGQRFALPAVGGIWTDPETGRRFRRMGQDGNAQGAWQEVQ